ncbi:MAG: DUF1203 domain-containing protein [Candidatus Eremiobacteraeota bacterium]|nr:DUF1203 domain-containing protein [Candidatus Eremiobacteraeota bacterium]
MNHTTTKLRYAVKAIPTDVAVRVRQTLTDDFGNRLSVSASDACAPCRHCLRLSVPGEPLILFAYRPFETPGPYAEIGPVFIHAESCPAYADRERFPGDFRTRVLTMRGYNEGGTIETAELSAAGDPDATLERLLSDERVRFVHVRNPAWGCYDFQVDRA